MLVMTSAASQGELAIPKAPRELSELLLTSRTFTNHPVPYKHQAPNPTQTPPAAAAGLTAAPTPG